VFPRRRWESAGVIWVLGNAIPYGQFIFQQCGGFVRKIWTFLVLGIALMLAACGGDNNNNGSINGNWTAALMSSNNNSSPVFDFSLTLTQLSGGNLSITNLNFTSSSPCFAGGANATGGFSLSGNFSGSVSGALQMNIQSATGDNQLGLQGTVKNNTVTGTWTLTGTTSGCTGSGTFTMNRS
jgi:hypothetical protein